MDERTAPVAERRLLAHLHVPAESVDVGPGFAAPEGKGFEVRFDYWTLEQK
jgi:hypothetical protein